jgi:hypothetical protein
MQTCGIKLNVCANRWMRGKAFAAADALGTAATPIPMPSLPIKLPDQSSSSSSGH